MIQTISFLYITFKDRWLNLPYRFVYCFLRSVQYMPENKRNSKTDFCRPLPLHLRSRCQQSIQQMVDLIRKVTVTDYLAFLASWMTSYIARMLQTILMLNLEKKCLKEYAVSPKQIVRNWHFLGGLVRILILTNFYLSVCAPSIIQDAETKVRSS